MLLDITELSPKTLFSLKGLLRILVFFNYIFLLGLNGIALRPESRLATNDLLGDVFYSVFFC